MEPPWERPFKHGANFHNITNFLERMRWTSIGEIPGVFGG